MSSPYNTAALHTLGCKVNFTETSTLSRRFQDKGISIVSFDQFADIYVINTCSVTENANIKCDRLVKSLKRKNPDAYIAVTGCYAQLKPKELSKNKDISLVVGSDNKMDIADIIMNDMDTSHIYSTDVNDIHNFKISFSESERVRSFLKVQDGCDYNCSFCTIPMARGKSRSATIEDVLDVTKSLEDKGFNEMVISGINLGDFQNDKKEDLLKLLIAIDNNTKIPRIRVSSIEPNLLSNEIIEFLSNSSRYLPHLHIPLQSGSNKILNLMKRRYTKEFYHEKIDEVKSKIPRICIGVDVITGFPMESEDDFSETYSLLQELDVSYLHVFPYSERENTLGTTLKPKVPQSIKISRSKKLRELSDVLKSSFILKNLDQEHNVLIEGIDNGWAFGYSENYIKVLTKQENLRINDIVKVKAVEIRDFEMIGEKI